MGEANAYLVA